MEAQLQALKVVDLKKLLQDAALPQSGTKADLIKRLLENPTATSSLGGASNAEEEDLLGESTNANQSIAKPAAKETAALSQPTDVAKTATPSTSAPVVVEKDDEARKADTLAELEKRKARAIKFGMSVEELDAKIQRIQRFGLQDDKDSSIQAIDGELKGGKKGKKDAQKDRNGNGTATENGKDAAKNKKNVSTPAPAPTPLDPIEEEKKRKRAERFGVPAAKEQPSDKKIKT